MQSHDSIFYGPELSGQEIFEQMYAKNDPVLRAEVRAALKKRGIHKIDPFSLELSLEYGYYEFEPKQPWFEKKNRLHARLRRTLRTMSDAPPEDWPHYAARIVNRILHRPFSWHRYDALSLPEHGIESQPHPAVFLKALQEGADPKEIVLSMCNTWMSRQAFIRCANALGNDVLAWDDERNLSWRVWKKERPENLYLCAEILVEPAGLVAVEPFTLDGMEGIDYDLYGSIVADVTSFVVSFKPKDGVDPKILRTHVDRAVADFIDKGWQTFRAPDCRYTNPDNAYDRPRRPRDEEFWDVDSLVTFLTSTLRDLYPDIVRAYEEQHFAEKDKKENASMLVHTEYAIVDFLMGTSFEKPLPPEMAEYIKTYQQEIEQNYHTEIRPSGEITVKKALIFNDVLELYKFCDGFLMPCESVAQTLNAARFAEECGPVKTPGGLDHLDEGYQNKNMSMTERLGNLADATPEELIDRAHHDVLVMLGTGESTLHTAFYQVATLAQGTIAGLLPDGTGHYPSLLQITDGTKEHAVASDGTLLPDRMRHMIERMANRFSPADSAVPLKERFMQAAKTAADLARHQEKIEKICKHYERHKERQHAITSGKSSYESLMDEMNEGIVVQERARALNSIVKGVDYDLSVSAENLIGMLLGAKKKPDFKADEFPTTTPPPAHLDTLGRYMWWRALATLSEQRAEDKKNGLNTPRQEPNKEVIARSNLARWGGEIGHQLPRGFKETGYITRNHHTPFARPGTELPRDLEAFVKDRAYNAGGLLLPDLSDVFTGPKI